ncbi:MAG: hypothetical protein CMF58_04270 [Lentimicrobiaceae bacterium]|nr:hypothetical protein [Lentimicrobiaceae bacterium]MDG1902408.1 PAS domain S-box protein [Bacteroidales bacterium]MDG2081888.1 PAS domain S-box protein [Bacteroidales bacterium]|tara:strand:- start:7802 stop:10210 length:2409 start_codon:yes stop_codon:yes gene_type:complete
MTKKPTNNIIRDILFLYEISLSIGGSLDLVNTMSDFVSILMPRKRFNYISIWLDKSEAFVSSVSKKSYKLHYSNPISYDNLKEVGHDHIIIKSLIKHRSLQVSSKNKKFKKFICEKHIKGGCYVIYKLGNFGFVKLYDSKVESYDETEIAKLSGIMEKFANAILACLYHERALDLSNERKKLLSNIQTREDYLLSMVRNYPGLFWLKDSNGVYKYLNTQNTKIIYDFFQSNGRNVLGKKDFQIFDNDIAQHIIEEDGHIKRTKKTIHTTKIIESDETKVWYESTKFPILQNETVIGVAGYAHDITERKNNELTMNLQSVAMNAVSHAILITNKDGVIKYINPAFTDLTGYLPNQIIGKTPSIMKLGLQDEFFYKNLWANILRGEKFNDKMMEVNFKGEKFYVEQSITPVTNKEDEITHFISVIKNITEEKAIKEALLLSEQRWQFALDGSGEGVWDWNPITDEVYYSMQWKKMLGHQENEIGTTLDEWKKRVHPDDIEECYKNLNKHLKGDTELYFNEHRMLHKNGHYIWILDRGKAITRDKNGKPTRVIGTHTDITKLKETEERLRIGIDKEKELRILKSKFISVASHEFRTPLATMMVAAEALSDYRDRMTPKQLDDRLAKIKRQIGYLNNIVDDVLQLEKFRMDNELLSFAEGDIIEYMRSIIDEIDASPVSSRIKKRYAIKSLEMVFDKKLIYQIITNLISNSIKFSNKSEDIIFEVETSNKHLIISISDKGMGISELDQNNIFDPFYRSDNTSSITGSGLGLSIVKEAVEKLKGEIKLKSKLNEGTTFTVALPIKKK